MGKKALACLLLIIFSLTMGLPTWAKDEEITELSLEQAKELALAHNPEIPLSQTAISKAQVGVSEARDMARQIETATTYELLQLKYVAPRGATMELRMAEVNGEFTKKVILLTVETSYYNVLRAEAEVANKEKSLERAQEQLRLAKASFAVGAVAKSDVMAAQVGVTAGQVDLASAKNGLDKAMMNLANVLGRPIDEKYILTDEFSYSPLEELDLDDYIEELLTKDLAVVAAKEGLAVAEVQFQQASSIYPPHVFAHRQARYDRDRAVIQYDQAKKDLALNARQAYLDLKTAEQAYGLLAENVEYAEETARLAALRYEAGVATQLEMEKAFDQLRETEAQRLSMLYNYNLAKTQLEHGIFASGSGADF